MDVPLPSDSGGSGGMMLDGCKHSWPHSFAMFRVSVTIRRSPLHSSLHCCLGAVKWSQLLSLQNIGRTLTLDHASIALGFTTHTWVWNGMDQHWFPKKANVTDLSRLLPVDCVLIALPQSYAAHVTVGWPPKAISDLRPRPFSILWRSSVWVWHMRTMPYIAIPCPKPSSFTNFCILEKLHITSIHKTHHFTPNHGIVANLRSKRLRALDLRLQQSPGRPKSWNGSGTACADLQPPGDAVPPAVLHLGNI